MRFAVALLFAGFASATLYQRQTVPQCALTCIADADLGDCSATDNACLCNNQQFVSSTSSCIQSSCSGDDLQNAIEFAQETCESVGVTLTDTSAGSATGSATSGGASATTTSPSSSGSASGSGSASSPSSTSASGARQTGVPILAAVGLGLAAFAL
ncbi:hypothetical protein ACEPAF_2870 [Sanghuangporus sanghuang]|uniref:CFEM domain-containing protein n=1 Tax=Sanghuangporus baumii TaxID=108892 RepID=A0A9Q5NBC1_SANBA|nr:hypothetical protein A7U60_g5633 [Sanghuangporus baumii]